MANQDIKEYSKKNGVYLWQIAFALGKSEATFNRMLRFELTAAEKEQVVSIIDAISESKSEKPDQRL